MGTKCGKVIVHKINDELRAGYLLLEDGRYWSFVAGERDGDYGVYHAGYAIEGCTTEKDERKDGEFWVNIGNPKEGGEGKPVKVLKATRCVKDEDGDMNFDDEPTFSAALYSNGTGVLQGFLYLEQGEEDEPKSKKKSKSSNSVKTSAKQSGSNKKKSGVDLW